MVSIVDNMKPILTDRQKELLKFIYRYLKDNGYPPTFEEMRGELNVVSNQSVIDLLSALEKKKLIRRDEGAARGLKILKQGYGALDTLELAPNLGASSAGPFVQDVEIAGEWQEISPEVTKLQDEVYVIKVKGDSMIGAGIDAGDTLLVKSAKEFVSGDIVVAQSPDGTTVKRFVSERKPPYMYLKPENPKYRHIPFFNITLQGKVIAVLRNGHWQFINKSKSFDILTKNEIVETDSEEINLKPYFQNQDITIYNDDIISIKSIPDSSIDLIVTSPPYNVDIHYNSNDDSISYQKYLEFIWKWLEKCFALTKNDGRFCLNIPLDKNKGGQQSVYADILKIAKDIGWRYHSTIIWNEGNISRRTAWGSWMSARAPYVIAPVEMIVVLYKKDWRKLGGSGKSDIAKNEFMTWTSGVWTFSGESKKRVGHPAPFPVELPKRCIKLFSFVGDAVLDPFLGSGTTLIAAYQNNRKGIGVDIDKTYCDLAIKRLNLEARINQTSLIK